MSLIKIIRDASIYHNTRGKIIAEIQAKANVDNITAKRLLFSFQYFPSEETLQGIVASGMVPPDIQGELDKAVALGL